MLEKATYVHTHTQKKHLSSHKASYFCFCSKHCFPLIIVSPLVSCLISATEYLLPFTTNSQSGSCLLSRNTVHLLIPINGRYTFHGRWQTELLIKCASAQWIQAKWRNKMQCPCLQLAVCLQSMLPTQSSQGTGTVCHSPN